MPLHWVWEGSAGKHNVTHCGNESLSEILFPGPLVPTEMWRRSSKDISKLDRTNTKAGYFMKATFCKILPLKVINCYEKQKHFLSVLFGRLQNSLQAKLVWRNVIWEKHNSCLWKYQDLESNKNMLYLKAVVPIVLAEEIIVLFC